MRATASELVYHRPWMAPYQLDAIFTAHRYAIIEASTKAGKTVGCLVWLAEQAMASSRGRNFWWIAPVLAQSRVAFRRLKAGLPHSVYSVNETELTITLLNGAVIWFKGGDHADSLYGDDVYAAVIDEASRCREETWIAVRTTLTATRGPIRIIGNVKGRRNWAYKMARLAESGSSDMHYARITANDAIKAGLLSSDEIADAKAKLPTSVFSELYEAIPSDDSGNPFGIDAIHACARPVIDATRTPVAWGWDLAKSTDWTVGIALDGIGNVCRFERWQAPWEVTIVRIVGLVGSVPALVDSTGVGDPVLEALQKHGSNYEGFKFSSSSKQQLMEGLALAIHHRDITYPDGTIVHELESIEYVYSRTGVHYSAPDGLHDDCVMALALSVRRRGRPSDVAAFLESVKR